MHRYCMWISVIYNGDLFLRSMDCVIVLIFSCVFSCKDTVCGFLACLILALIVSPI